MTIYPDAFLDDIQHVLHVEGGNADRPLSADPGGPTSHGVTLRTYNAWRKLHGRDRVGKQAMFAHLTGSPETVRDIYYTLYWLKVNAVNIPETIRILVFDVSVLQGVRGIKRIQAILGLRQDGVVGPNTQAAIAKAASTPTKASRLASRITSDRWKYLQTRAHFKDNKNGWRKRVNYMRDVAHGRAEDNRLEAAAVVAAEKAEAEHQAERERVAEERRQRFVETKPEPPVHRAVPTTKETDVQNTKASLKSKTIWAGIIQLLVAVAGMLGLDIAPGEVEAIPGHIESVVIGITGLLTIFGRFGAKEKITVL